MDDSINYTMYHKKLIIVSIQRREYVTEWLKMYHENLSNYNDIERERET